MKSLALGLFTLFANSCYVQYSLKAKRAKCLISNICGSAVSNNCIMRFKTCQQYN